MKKILLSLAVCLSLPAAAQTNAVVTLTSGTATTQYYGTNGFADAVAASQDGDLITLSAGTFAGTTVDKSLTIKGNGALGEEATHITSKVILQSSADKDNQWLNVQGIDFAANVNLFKGQYAQPDTVRNVVFSKCVLTTFGTEEYYPSKYYYGTAENFCFVQCLIKNEAQITNYSKISFINTVAGGAKYRGDYIVNNNTLCDVRAVNSVLITNLQPSDLYALSARNSVIFVACTNTSYYAEKYYYLPSCVVAENCLFTGNLAGWLDHLFGSIDAHGSQWMPLGDVYEGLTNYSAYDPNCPYTLAATAAAFLGTDGTQVGAYGGSTPLSFDVPYPVISSLKVDDKAVDGTLGVEVEVK